MHLRETSIIGLLFSGGLDSCILLGDLLRRGHRVLPIYVESGLLWQEAELRSVHRFLHALDNQAVEPLNLLSIPLSDVYLDHWSLTGKGVPDAQSLDHAVYLPGRNALLLVKAALCCQCHGIEDLALGVLGTSPFSDAKPSFFSLFAETMNAALDATLRIHLPFVDATKQDVMRLGRDLPLEWTFSCVAPQQQLHCGQCNKCLERQRAFQQVGLDDPTKYASGHLIT